MSRGRYPSIELLRILSMLMVVAFHWQLHGNYILCVFAMFTVGVIAEFLYCNTIEKMLHRIYERFRIGKVSAWEE